MVVTLCLCQLAILRLFYSPNSNISFSYLIDVIVDKLFGRMGSFRQRSLELHAGSNWGFEGQYPTASSCWESNCKYPAPISISIEKRLLVKAPMWRK